MTQGESGTWEQNKTPREPGDGNEASEHSVKLMKASDLEAAKTVCAQ